MGKIIGIAIITIAILIAIILLLFIFEIELKICQVSTGGTFSCTITEFFSGTVKVVN